MNLHEFYFNSFMKFQDKNILRISIPTIKIDDDLEI